MKQIIVLKKNSAAVCVHRGFGPIRKTSVSHPEAEGRLHRGLRSSMSEMCSLLTDGKVFLTLLDETPRDVMKQQQSITRTFTTVLNPL